MVVREWIFAIARSHRHVNHEHTLVDPTIYQCVDVTRDVQVWILSDQLLPDVFQGLCVTVLCGHERYTPRIVIRVRSLPYYTHTYILGLDTVHDLEDAFPRGVHGGDI